ncbi:MAG: hypothetical protein JEZ02_22015 [Desulfatibacillum sp.]|nr:hypothetical protein [Desulfatibacillum sp.]
MAKRKKRIDYGGPKQLNLFDMARVVAEKVKAFEASPTEGTGNVAEKLRIAIKASLKSCPLSRHQVAGEMSHLIGNVEVTKYMLDAWTCESKEGHRFPAEFLPAFCQVTDCREPLRVLAEASGWFALPGEDALRSQMQKIEEEIKRMKSQKQEISVLIKRAGDK